MSKNTLTTILKEQREVFLKKDLGVERTLLKEVEKLLDTPHVVVLTGLRRVGKSTLLLQIAKKYLKEDFFFVNFEDERLVDFQAEDFDNLHECLVSLYGEKKVFLIDEIQNVPNWEKFVRRMHDSGYKFFVTGSNASLLSLELGTRLTGRSVQVELYPFSFEEFLCFKDVKKKGIENLTTVERGNMRRWCNEYLKKGGIPDSLKYPKLDVHKSLYYDVLYRDIATRYGIKNVKGLKELSYFILTNTSSLISLNNLKKVFKFRSVNTVAEYVSYLENSWLFILMNKYAYSLKEQQVALKKVYAIDTGLVNSIGFSFSKNKGKLIENVVFLHLKRKYEEVYYLKTKDGYEVDFYIPEEKLLIQVADNLENSKTREREFRSILEVSRGDYDVKRSVVVTQSEKEEVEQEGVSIEVVPLYEFLLKK